MDDRLPPCQCLASVHRGQEFETLLWPKQSLQLSCLSAIVDQPSGLRVCDSRGKTNRDTQAPRHAAVHALGSPSVIACSGHTHNAGASAAFQKVPPLTGKDALGDAAMPLTGVPGLQ